MNDDIKTTGMYANGVTVTTSLYDVVINFRNEFPTKKSSSGEPEHVVTISEVCNVHMSPQHAKALAVILVRQAIEYEANHKIKLPIAEDMQAYWDKYVKED